MVLDFIRRWTDDRGYPPTLREIGAHMGIRSTNGVNDHLRALERKGFLARADGLPRTMTVMDSVSKGPPPPGQSVCPCCGREWT